MVISNTFICTVLHSGSRVTVQLNSGGKKNSESNSFKKNAKKCSGKRGNPAYRCQMCSNKECPLYHQPINRDTGGVININMVAQSNFSCEITRTFSRKHK